MLTTTSQQLAWLAEFWPPRSGTLSKPQTDPVGLQYRLELFTRLGHELH
jgi:hypothetical protein